MGNLCCASEHSVQFFVQFFTQLNLGCVGPLTRQLLLHQHLFQSVSAAGSTILISVLL